MKLNSAGKKSNFKATVRGKEGGKCPMWRSLKKMGKNGGDPKKVQVHGGESNGRTWGGSKTGELPSSGKITQSRGGNKNLAEKKEPGRHAKRKQLCTCSARKSASIKQRPVAIVRGGEGLCYYEEAY